MTQAERDRLVTLKKAKKKLITQAEAAELRVSVRHVKRMLKNLARHGDKSVMHGLRGEESNRKIDGKVRQKAVKILSAEVYRGFGPTLAGEHLAKKHGIDVSRETLRKWMQTEGLWKGRRRRPEKVHVWRERRSRYGELVQWDTSDHDWLEGRGGSERLYLIAMIDDATSRLYARFVRSDSTEENMRTLREYLQLYGRPLAFYTDKASLFHTTEKRRRDEAGVDQDPKVMPPTQIGRALRELNITWIAAHSPQANQYLRDEFLPWWNETLTVEPASADNAHRKLDKQHDLAAILSQVETRLVKANYTVPVDGRHYAIDKGSISAGLRGGTVRVEQRLDGTMAMRFKDRYLAFKMCTEPVKTVTAAKRKPAKDTSAQGAATRRKSKWMDGFWDKPSPSMKDAIRIANSTS